MTSSTPTSSTPTSSTPPTRRAGHRPAWVANRARDRAWRCDPVSPRVRAFHQTLPEYTPTDLTELPGLARGLAVAHLFVKDESNRLALPAFKGLGASWAIHRALGEHRLAAGALPVTLVTATDGNHGRAVARFARLLHQRAHIFVPDGVHPAAVGAVRDEGADVTSIRGSYDQAVRAAARHAADRDDHLLVQDTAWDGYEEVPGWIVEGYSTLFGEVDEQLRDTGIGCPDVVVVPTGVGSLLQAALTHYRSRSQACSTAVVSVEPVGAACVLSSVVAGEPVTVQTGVTAMAGLNCGTVSTLAWPHIRRGLDAGVTVTDRQAAQAAHELAAAGVPAGPCGAASLAAARVLSDPQAGPSAAPVGGFGPLSPDATVVLLVTEGSAANPGLGA